MSSWDVFRIMSGISDGTFCKNSQRLLTVHYIFKTLHFRYLRGLWIRLRHLWHKFIACTFNQVKKEHIPINILRFFLDDSSNEDCAFAGLNNFFAFHEFLCLLLLNEFLQSEIMQKSRSVQIIRSIIAVTDE